MDGQDRDYKPTGQLERAGCAGQPQTDLALMAELEIVENIDLLQDFDVLVAWDGQTP